MANIKTDQRLALQRALEQQLGRTPRTLEQQAASARNSGVPRYPGTQGMTVKEIFGSNYRQQVAEAQRAAELARNSGPSPDVTAKAFAERSRARVAAQRTAAAAPTPTPTPTPTSAPTQPQQPKTGLKKLLSRTPKPSGTPGLLSRAKSFAGKAGLAGAALSAAPEVFSTPTEQYRDAASSLLGAPDADTSNESLLVRDVINRGAGAVGEVASNLTLGVLPNWMRKQQPAAATPVATTPVATTGDKTGAQAAARKADGPQTSAPAAQPFNAMQPAGTGSDGRTQIGDVTVANSELETKTGGKLVADGILRQGNTFTNLVDGQRIGAPAVPGQKDNVVDMMERVAARDAAVNSQAPVVAVMGGGSASQSSGSGIVDYFREAGQRKQQRAQDLQAQQDTAAMQRQQAGDATQREVAAANNQQSLFRQLLSDEAAQRRAEIEAQGKQELSVSDMLAISRERRDQANQYQSQNIDTLKGLFASEADPKGEAGYAQNRGRFDATAVQLGWGTNATELNPAQLQNLATARQLEQKIAGQGWLARGQAPAASADYTAYLPAQATGGKGGYSLDPNNPEMVVGRDASGRVVWSATRQAVQTQDPNMLQSLFNLGPLRSSSVDQRFN